MPFSKSPNSPIFSWPDNAHWRVYLLIGLLCLCTGLSEEHGRELLRYQKDLIETKEYWRLLSAHFVHLSWSHLVLNILGFLAIWLLYANIYFVKNWLMLILCACFGISLCFLFFDAQLDWYVGLSGVLHALLASVLMYISLQGMFNADVTYRWEDGLLLVFLLAKVVYEQWQGALPFSEYSSGGSVIVNAHFYGFLIGCIYAVFLFKYTNYKKSIN